MPLWKFYHPVEAFTDDEKREISERITTLYTSANQYSEVGLPAFYVGVIFQEIAEGSFYIGGKPTKNFVRIWVDHIARRIESAEERGNALAIINEAIAPYIRDRDFDWEFHIDETPFELWSIQGYRPPHLDSEDGARWIRENKPSPLVGTAA